MIDRKKHLLSTTMVAGLVALGALTVAPTVAFAQSQEDEQADDDTEVEEVIVVGSRIRRDTYNSPSPVQIVTREETTLAGYNSTTEALQGTAVSGGSAQINNAFGGFVTDGGPGANTLSLRGLGPTRTLVLLNGRRIAPAGSRGAVGSADLNVLPSAIVERIEILRDGASSIYGSDAIAGVVNVITRQDIEGIEVEGQYNFTTDANGGGDESRIAIVGGNQFGRLRLSGALEYTTRDELRVGDRDFTSDCPRDFFDYPDGTTDDYIDPRTGQPKCFGLNSGGVTINTIATPSITSDPLIASLRPDLIFIPGIIEGIGTEPLFAIYNRFRPGLAGPLGLEAVGGQLAIPVDNTGPDIDGDGFGDPDGIPDGVAVGAATTEARDTFYDALLNESLISPVENTTFYVEAGYDLGFLGDAELYADTLITRRESSQTGSRQLVLDYPLGSPLIPEELRFSRPTPGGSVTTNGLPIGIRAFIGFGNDTSRQEQDFSKTTVGIRGDFILPDWRYDAYLMHSDSRAEYVFSNFLIDRIANSVDLVAAPAGLDPRLVNNGFTCRVNLNPVNGCIPAPLLNSQTVGGIIAQDYRDYIFRPVTGVTDYTETVFNFGIDGPLYRLPAGEVGAFFGIEYRESEIDDTPGQDSQTGNQLNFTSATPTRGTDSVWEAYGEVEVPILANMTGAQELTLNVSGRYTDYESYGDDTTYKIGLLWTPFDPISFRGTYGTSFRAPALFEQFQGASSGFLGQSGDPCNDFDAEDNAGTNLAINCGSEGLPEAFNATTGITVLTLGGAETGLEAETSTNKTFGVILQPELPGTFGEFAFAVDYYEIEVENGVGQFGAGGILGQCYNSAPSDFNADNEFCRFVERQGASPFALTVEQGYVNIATFRVEGIDYNIRWNRDLGAGEILANLQVTQYLEQFSQTSPDDPGTDFNGTIASPDFTATADLSYDWNEWRVRYGVEWVASTDSYDLLEITPEDGFIADTDDYYIHNASVRYQAEDDWQVVVGVRNLFDEDLPEVSALVTTRVGNAPLYSAYDYIGRRVFISLSKAF